MHKMGIFLFFIAFCSEVYAGIPGNLPASFYERKGLENMPRTDYAQMVKVNVCDMGADPSGVKACNEAFSKGLEALKAKGGGVLYIPSGRYRFASPKSEKDARYAWRNEKLENIHFLGDGPEKSVIFADWDAVRNTGNPAPYLWNFSSCTKISFRDLGFTVFPYFAMRGPYACEGLFHLAFGGNTDVQVLNVFSDQGRMGIVFWGGNRRCWVVGCDVRNTGADAIKFDSCEDVVAAYNYIENNNDDGFSGLRMSAGPSKNNAFIYNTLIYSRGWGRGVPVSGQNHRVEGNWIEAQGMLGVMLHEIGYKEKKVDEGEPNGPFRIADNTIIRANLHNTPKNQLVGHRISGAIGSYSNRINGCDISGNLILAAQGDAIGFGKFYSGCKLEDIIIRDNTMALNLGGAVWSGCEGISVLSKVLIKGNRILGNQVNSILCGKPIADCKIENNTVMPAAEGFSDIYSGVRDLPDETALAAEPNPVAQGPVLNVRDFGAVGDGKVCDTVAFSKAIGAIPANGGTLNIPAGRYRIDPLPSNDSLPFTCIKHHLCIKDKSNVSIVGDGDSSVLVFSSVNHEGLRLIGLKDSSVKSLVFEVSGNSPFRKSRAPLDIVASENILIEKVLSRNSAGQGIRLDACRRVLMEDCRIESAGQSGINILGGRQITVRRCQVANSRDYGINVSCMGGIARLPQFISIEGNDIKGSREAHGVSVINGTMIKVKDNRISGCYQAGVAIYAVNPIFPVEKVDVSGNRIEACASGELSYMRGAISVFFLPSKERRTKGNSDITVSGNRIIRSAANGIWVDSCKGMGRVAISGNLTEEVTGSPVSISPEQRRQIETLELDVNTADDR